MAFVLVDGVLVGRSMLVNVGRCACISSVVIERELPWIDVHALVVSIRGTCLSVGTPGLYLVGVMKILRLTGLIFNIFHQLVDVWHSAQWWSVDGHFMSRNHSTQSYLE